MTMNARQYQEYRAIRLVGEYKSLILDHVKTLVENEYFKAPNDTNDEDDWDTIYEECFNAGNSFATGLSLDRFPARNLLVMINYIQREEVEQSGAIVERDDFPIENVIDLMAYYLCKSEFYEEWKQVIIEASQTSDE